MHNLTACPSCRQDCSIYAAACPSCGHPNPGAGLIQPPPERQVARAVLSASLHLQILTSALPIALTIQFVIWIIAIGTGHGTPDFVPFFLMCYGAVTGLWYLLWWAMDHA